MRGTYGKARSLVGYERRAFKVPRLGPDGSVQGDGVGYPGPLYFNTAPAYYVDNGPSSFWLFNDDGQAASRAALQTAPHGMQAIELGDKLPGLLGLGRLATEYFYVLPAATPGHQATKVGNSLAVSQPEARSLWEQVKVGTVLTLSAVAVLLTGKVLSPDGKRRRSY